MIKYNLAKLDTPGNCWYEIPINQVKQLFEDERFTGEIVHLYNDSEDGAESLIQTDKELGDAIFEALEDHTPFVVHSQDVIEHEELFEIRKENN